MKRLFLPLILLFVLSVPCLAKDPELRGTWVSTVYNLDFPSQSNLSQAQLKKEADIIIDSVAAMGLNTIFLQVRPCSDAIYPSDIFPWSKYISGTQGVAPDHNFDTLQYFIEAAHARGIQLHAWINPYRITVSAFQTKEDGLASLSTDHPAVKNPDWVKQGNDQKLYFDPALPQVQQLIADGVREITERYDVDGIHFDDYFYPDDAFDDTDSYTQYGAGYNSVEDFRRENVNKIVKTIQDICSAADIRFGISPFGVWANKKTHPDGSNTLSNQSYFSHYADTRLWVKEGWVDYIAPQLYWNIGSNEAGFEELITWWKDIVCGTGVDLYIGLAAYKSADATDGSSWYLGDELKNQLKMADMYGLHDGVIFFRYSSLLSIPGFSEYLDDTFDYPLPQIGAPLFLSTQLETEILSPSSNIPNVSGLIFKLSCTSPCGSVYAATDSTLTRLTYRFDSYTGHCYAKKSGGILFICENNGFVSTSVSASTLLSSKNKNTITSVYTDKTDNSLTITFLTQYPASATALFKDDYLYLDMAPCRKGFVFECDDIRSMICTDISDAQIRYVFDFYTRYTGCKTEHYPDKIVLRLTY